MQHMCCKSNNIHEQGTGTKQGTGVCTWLGRGNIAPPPPPTHQN